MNKKFNCITLRESMWRNIIRMNYGIDKIYGTSWKDTAKNLFLCNMINLNKIWIDNITYGELFYQGLENWAETSKILWKYNMLNRGDEMYDKLKSTPRYEILKYVFPKSITNIKRMRRHIRHISNFDRYYGVAPLTELSLEQHIRTITRELFVILSLFKI